jgi:tRNA/tmRNA/rRNA uracil-C5-methylase (TrmA/RlmC/RlmD family)
MSSDRNYVKFDFNNIKLAHTWKKEICIVKDILIEYINKNSYNIFKNEIVNDTLNFYAVTSKLTSLNQIYILIIFVSNENNFHLKYINVLKNLYTVLVEKTKFDSISFWYQLTESKMKPNESVPIIHIDGFKDICESIGDFKVYISPNSFTQSNYNGMIELYELIKGITSNCGSRDTVHYYGRGMTPMLLYIRNNFKKMYGYSSCEIAYNDGLKSLKMNSVDNIELIYDKEKEKFFQNINTSEGGENNIIMISASRNGFRKINKINKFKRFIYIACNIESFLDEIQGLSISYKVLGEIDMFPGTTFKEIIFDIKRI